MPPVLIKAGYGREPSICYEPESVIPGKHSDKDLKNQNKTNKQNKTNLPLIKDSQPQVFVLQIKLSLFSLNHLGHGVIVPSLWQPLAYGTVFCLLKQRLNSCIAGRVSVQGNLLSSFPSEKRNIDHFYFMARYAKYRSHQAR